MIPTRDQIFELWELYHLPEQKRIHVLLVAKVALFMAKRLQKMQPNVFINIQLLESAALLHDIDKMIPRKPGEQHPDAAVRVLREHGYDEVADIVVTHPLHSILDTTISPKTWEEKLLYLSDKMVKYDIVGVDKRFALWNAEHLPDDAQRILDASYPKVKQLEKEVFEMLHLSQLDLAQLA